MSRFMRHVCLLVVSVVALAAAATWLPYAAPWERVSIASAWLCMLLLLSVFLIGPVRRLQGRPTPVNIYLRRDLAIWAALQGLLHFYAGNVVAMNQVYLTSFVRNVSAASSPELREALFAGGSILGTVVALLFVLLLALSSDRAIRLLGSVRWKNWQRSAQLALWLTVAHGIAFQLLEARYVPMLLLVLLSSVLLGFRLRARR